MCTTYIQEDKRTAAYLMDRIVAPFGAMPISFSPIAENRPNRQAKKIADEKAQGGLIDSCWKGGHQSQDFDQNDWVPQELELP